MRRLKMALLIVAIVAGFVGIVGWVDKSLIMPCMYIPLGAFMVIRAIETWKEDFKLGAILDTIAAILMAILSVMYIAQNF